MNKTYFIKIGCVWDISDSCDTKLVREVTVIVIGNKEAFCVKYC